MTNFLDFSNSELCSIRGNLKLTGQRSLILIC